jgi:thiamine pyrophosphate-dependent acetolactate synthase large subunit-like protein
MTTDEGHGVPATRATTAEEFHQQFEAAMRMKGPHLIEAQNRRGSQADDRRCA